MSAVERRKINMKKQDIIFSHNNHLLFARKNMNNNNF